MSARAAPRLCPDVITEVQAAIRASSRMLPSLHWIDTAESVCGGDGGDDAPSVSVVRARISANIMVRLPLSSSHPGIVAIGDTIGSARLIGNARYEDEAKTQIVMGMPPDSLF